MSNTAAPDYEAISPYTFVRTLPICAENRIPPELKDYCTKAQFEAWSILEEGVFFLFRQIFMLPTVKLGHNALFKHEPEGIVLWDRCGTKNAFLYECKARRKGYTMSSDDVLRYKDYVAKKRHIVAVKYYLPLSHLVIVSSDFHGDIDARLREFDVEGITLSLVTADNLMDLYERTKEFEYEDFLLLDLPKLFCRGEVTSGHISKVIDQLDQDSG